MSILSDKWISKMALEQKMKVSINVQNKNPGIHNGYTALHLAAESGHLDVCKLIVGNIQDKNPRALDGNTPLHDIAVTASRICLPA